LTAKVVMINPLGWPVQFIKSGTERIVLKKWGMKQFW
jgi:hypothetical protein